MDAERREYLEMQLSAYLDGELTPQELAEVEAWLAAEPEARRLAAQLRVTVEAVQSLPRARASEELLSNLRNRLERQALLEMAKPAEVVTRTPILSWGKWVAAAAVIGLTFVAGYFTWTLRSGQQVSGPQYALQDADKSPDRLVYSADGRKDTRWRGSSTESEASRKPAAVAPSASPPPPPASPAAKPAGSVGEKFALAKHLTPTKPSEQLLLPSAEGEKDTSAGTVVALKEKTVEETDLAEEAAKRLLAGGGGFVLWEQRRQGTAIRRSGISLAKGSPDRVPVDGRTRVMTFAFADADSRAMAIESLQREVLMDGADERAKVARRQASRSSKTAAQPQAAAPSASVPVAPGSAASPRSLAESLSKTKETQYGFEAGGSNAVDKVGGDEALLSGHGRVASVQTDRASRVNVLRIDTADDATAERLMVVLGGEAKQGAAGIHSRAAAVADLGRFKAEGADRLGGERKMKTLADESTNGTHTEADGDGIRDKANFAGGTDSSLTLSQPVAPQQPPGGVAATRPSASGSPITWDIPSFTATDSGRGCADDQLGVANGAFDFKLDRDATGDYYGDFSGVPATAPARLPQTRGEHYDGYGWFKEGMAEAGMAGRGAMYRATRGNDAVTAPAASSASRPASRPSGWQPDENLLVVYFRVLSPETRPADRFTASAPSPATPASQPATRP